MENVSREGKKWYKRCILASFNHTNRPLRCLPYVSLCFGGFYFGLSHSKIQGYIRIQGFSSNSLPSALFKIGFFPLLSVESFDFLGDFDVLSEMMKRDSVSAGFDQSLGFDNGAVAKLKYQTLVGEFLELQKDFVSRKRKLHAAMQKRDTILAEVRFLRRRRNDLLQNQAFNTEEDPIHLSNSYIKSKALKGEISFDGLEAMPENSNRFLLSDSHSAETEGVRDIEVLGLKPMNSVIHHKTAGKRKISCLIKSR